MANKKNLSREELLSQLENAEIELIMLRRELSFIREVERKNLWVEQRKQTIERKNKMVKDITNVELIEDIMKRKRKRTRYSWV